MTKANRRIRLLEEKLAALESSARAELELMRRTFADRLNIGDDVDTAKKDTIVKKEPGERDDDTHYFDSYSYNGSSNFQSFMAHAAGLTRDS